MKIYNLLIWSSIFVISELFYFRIARFFRIVDKPNERSLHSNITIRGGGIIYWIAGLTYFIYSDFAYLYFFLGFTIIVFISFLDDIFNLPSNYRLLFQFFGILLLLNQFSFSTSYPYWLFFPLSVLCISIINAYNFMDGINGITGAYSLILILSLNYINFFIVPFIETDFLIIVLISICVFLLFNFRKEAVCFGGDVGSIGIAFILIFFVGQLIHISGNWKYIFLFSFYGLDTLYTIIYRLRIRENIFRAHKLHFFQLLVYKYRFSHLQVATSYALGQLLFNIWVIKQSATNPLFYLPILFVLGFMHLVRKKQGLAITIK